MLHLIDSENILAALPNGSVAILDQDFTYVYAAGRGLEEVGLDPATLVGQPLSSLFPAEAVEFVAPAYRRAFQGETAVARLPFFHRTYSVAAGPYRREGNRVTHILVVSQDVTVLAPADRLDGPRRSADDANVVDRRDILVAAVAHELRNPVGAMKMALTLLARTEEQFSRSRALEVLERQIRTIETLAAGLEDLDRTSGGPLSLSYDTVDAADLVRDAQEAVRHRAEAQTRHVEVAVPRGHIHLRVDRSRMSQALGNLLTNALHYTPAGGTITLGVERGHEHVDLYIRDSGIGIDPAELSLIFEPFQRGRTAITYAGSGLGLWVAREIALLHGGEIQAASEGPGRGATFTIRLPLALLARQEESTR